MIEDNHAPNSIFERLIRQRRALLALEPSQSQRQRLANVEAALLWLRAGVYGRCSVCASELDATALESDPAIVACKLCLRLGRSRPFRPRRAVGSSCPGAFGLVSIEDEDELRQVQFEAASRMATWVRAH
jgi:hypothetical protein